MAENGGHTISDFVKRNMKFLFESAYATRQLNLTGQRGKRAFRSLTLFPLVLYGLFIILSLVIHPVYRSFSIA